MSEALSIEVIKIIPSLVTLIIVLIGLFILHKPVLKLLEKITHLQAFGVDVNFKETAEENLKAAIKSYKVDKSLSNKRFQEIINKAESLQDHLKGSRILWVDDTPLANANIHHFLNQFGVIIDNTTRTDEVIAALRWGASAYKVIITDMYRDGNGTEGLKLLEEIAKLINEMKTNRNDSWLDIPPVIVFVSEVDPNRPQPEGSQIITDRVDELLTEIFIIIEAS
jgi:CheY-like chemotaxis protein